MPSTLSGGGAPKRGALSVRRGANMQRYATVCEVTNLKRVGKIISKIVVHMETPLVGSNTSITSLLIQVYRGESVFTQEYTASRKHLLVNVIRDFNIYFSST